MTTKTKASNKTMDTRSVYTTSMYSGVENGFLEDELGNGYFDNLEDAKECAVSYLEEDSDEIYVYKITFTKVLKGTKAPVIWEKQ